MLEAREVEDATAVRRAARELDYDRYLAALLAPRPARGRLLALAAFHGEIARIPASVREPAMGAIRLQWWRDQLDAASTDEGSGSPVAYGLRAALGGDETMLGEAMAIIDAYEQLLYPAVLAAPGALDAFVDAGQGAAFRLAARMLGATDDGSTALISAGAQSYGRVQLLRALPILLHKGHNPFREGHTDDWCAIAEPLLAAARVALDEVRRLAPLAPATIRQAILPVALVGPYLKALEGLGSKLAFEQATISPLSRVWRIYAAKRFRRF